MGGIQIEHLDGIVLLKLNRGVTNPLNLALVQEISGAVQDARENPDIRGLVLTSVGDKFFSIGFDIPELLSVTREEFGVFYRTFNQLSLDLYTLSIPTAAAITGHAVAGGCILALCCDHRAIAEGHKLMGLNEVKLGVPVPYPGDSILRQLVSPQFAREILLKGEFYEPEQSLRMGMVDEVIPRGQVLSRSIERVRSLGSLPRKGFRAIKENRTGPVAAEIRASLEEKEESFMRCWHSVEAQELLQEASMKF